MVRSLYKEVKIKVNMKVKKSALLDIIIASIQAGKYPAQIAKEQKISKQKLHYYLRKLKDEGLIVKKGYGVWETNFYSNQVGHMVRGHGFMWKVKLHHHFQWKNILLKKKIPFKEQKNKTIRIIVNERKIWLGQKNIIIYEPASFFGRNSIESKKFAVLKLLKLLGVLEAKFGLSLKGKEGYTFKVRRQHYALIKNALAIQCNEAGEKIQVYNKEGLWFLVDNSYNLEEAETVHKDSAMLDNLGIQKYFNSHKDTGFQVTPSFILDYMNKANHLMIGMQKNQMIFDSNMSSHLEVLQNIGKAITELKEEIKKINGKT